MKDKNNMNTRMPFTVFSYYKINILIVILIKKIITTIL